LCIFFSRAQGIKENFLTFFTRFGESIYEIFMHCTIFLRCTNFAYKLTA
jgi:hypothetical protein